MKISPIKRVLPLLGWCLLVFVTAVYGPALAVAQTPRLAKLGPVAPSLATGPALVRARKSTRQPYLPKIEKYRGQTIREAWPVGQ